MPDPLATTDDIAARLGRDLTDAELTRSQVLLADASAQIRRYCKQDFGLHTGQDTVFRGPGGVIKFPDRTTTAVHSVTAIGGSPGLPDFRVPLWNFDEVVAVCANAVIGVLQAPTQAAGIISEQIGPYSYRLEKSGGGIAVALTQADLASLKDFRLGTLGTIKTGTGGQW
jgi:hypothetical protein